MEQNLNKEFIKEKKDKANSLYNKLSSILENMEKVDESVKESLPRLKDGIIEEKELSDYTQKLEKAINDPIHQRRISILKGLGIENLSTELIDNQEIETSIEFLNQLKKGENLFPIIAENFNNYISRYGIEKINERLKIILEKSDEFENLIKDLADTNVKNFYAQTVLENLFSNKNASNESEIIGKIKLIKKIQSMIKKPIIFDDLQKLSKANQFLSELENIKFDLKTMGIKDDFNTLLNYLEEAFNRFQNMKSEYIFLEKLLGKMKPYYDFPSLKNALDIAKEEISSNKGVKNFDEIITFILSDDGSLNADCNDLKEFLNLMKPLIQGVLKSDK